MQVPQQKTFCRSKTSHYEDMAKHFGYVSARVTPKEFLLGQVIIIYLIFSTGKGIVG
jgi:hypothetical protein